ncbi:alpha/beta hydrolase [Marmoricola endophyticus]|nr:alpha/beta hydrolase [Marmoricola endophyticus]
MTRSLITTGLAANALRPLRGQRTSIGLFGVGLLAGELAPQLLAATAADTAYSLLRGRARTRDLVAAGAAVGVLASLVRPAWGAGRAVEEALEAGIGADYATRLDHAPTPAELRTQWRPLTHPFRMRLREVERIRDIAYAPGGVRHRLDVYRPKPVPGDPPLRDAPVLVQVHGGAWVYGSKNAQGQLLMNRMAARGWVCVAVNYRLSDKHPWPAQIVDVKRALAWVKQHIGSYGGDPTYVVLTGGSAGGHLTALAALTPGDAEFQPGFEDADTSVAAAVPFYGVYDVAGLDGTRESKRIRNFFGRRVIHERPDEQHVETFRRASPLTRVREDAPDFFCLHGSADTVVPVGQAHGFVTAMRERSRASVTYAELPGAQHAFETFASIRSQHTIKAVQRWLEWHRAGRT